MNGIVLHPKRTTRILFIILGVLVTLSVIASFCHPVLHKRVEAFSILVDLDTEANLPTLFNVLLFYFGAALFLLHAWEATKKAARGWKTMAWVFVFLGIDEGAQVHEKLIQVTRRLLESHDGGHAVGGWFYYAWVIPYALAMLVLAVFLFRWFMGLSPILQKRLVISGIVYVFGAMFMEMAGGKLVASLPPVDPASYPWMLNTAPGGANDISFSMQPGVIAFYTVEEFCEMAGLILCGRALLLAFEANRKQVQLSVTELDTTDPDA